VFDATTYIGETGLTTPPFFRNARRGTNVTWGLLDDSPVVVNWSGLCDLERTELVPTLLATNNWILLTHLLGPAKSVTSPFPYGARRILLNKGNASREKTLVEDWY